MTKITNSNITLEDIKKSFDPVDSGWCLNQCNKKVIKDKTNPEKFIVVCNSCKRLIFEVDDSPRKTNTF